jgi:hypothetical protein
MRIADLIHSFFYPALNHVFYLSGYFIIIGFFPSHGLKEKKLSKQSTNDTAIVLKKAGSKGLSILNSALRQN